MLLITIQNKLQRASCPQHMHRFSCGNSCQLSFQPLSTPLSRWFCDVLRALPAGVDCSVLVGNCHLASLPE
jgi:hypothetical protein